MGLLGPKDHRMTLRYAAVLPETVGSEYHEALTQIEARYSAAPSDAKIVTSAQMLTDVLKWLRSKRAAAATDEAGRLASLVRRLDAIMDEVHAIEQREVNR
jgi:hypothetical protein